MDTKSKNNHKLAVLIIALVILLPSLAMMFIRPHYISRQKEDGQISYSNTDLMDQLVKDTYVLYAEEYQREHGSDVTPFEIFFQRDTSVEENTPLRKIPRIKKPPVTLLPTALPLKTARPRIRHPEKTPPILHLQQDPPMIHLRSQPLQKKALKRLMKMT